MTASASGAEVQRAASAPTARARTASSPICADLVAADSGRGAGRLPGRRPARQAHGARRSTAARSCAAACVGVASVYSASQARLGLDLGVGARRRPPARCRRASSASTSTAATTASTRSSRSTRPSSRPTTRQRAEHRPRARPVDRRQGRHDGHGRHRAARSAFANPLRVRHRQQRRHAFGFDTLYGDGSGGAGSDLAVFPAADYTPPNLSHFESRDYWFAGALQQMQTGWLGRWLDNYGSTDNPLQAISLDCSLSKQIRSAKAPVCAIQNLNGVELHDPERQHRQRQRRGREARRASRPARATTRSRAPARSTA